MQEILDLLRQYYDAFNRGDWDAMLDLLADDVVHDINQGERQVGRSTFAAFLQRMNRNYSERLEDITVMAAPDGKRAAAEYTVHGTYMKTDEDLPEAHGQTYVLPGGAFFEVQGGRIVRVTNYYNLPEWIRQVSGPAGGA